MTNTIETRRFETPDDALDMKEHGGINIVRMRGGATGMHAIFEPGWTWEKDEKPLLGDSVPTLGVRGRARSPRRSVARGRV